jgi:hypothetical protein
MVPIKPGAGFLTGKTIACILTMIKYGNVTIFIHIVLAGQIIKSVARIPFLYQTQRFDAWNAS